MQKRLGTGISEYTWHIGQYNPNSEMYSLNVVDPRDGEVIIMSQWPHAVISDGDRKIMLNIYLSAFYRGARHGAEKKAREVRIALGIEVE